LGLIVTIFDEGNFIDEGNNSPGLVNNTQKIREFDIILCQTLEFTVLMLRKWLKAYAQIYLDSTTLLTILC